MKTECHLKGFLDSHSLGPLDFEMPAIPEPPIYIVASELPNDLSIKALATIIIVIGIRIIIHYASPKRLTDILVVAMAELKKTYVKALDTGHISAFETERFNTMKCKVSTIQAETLDDSRLYLKTICGFLKGRTFTVLLCIWEVEDLERQIKFAGQIQSLTPQPSARAQMAR
ncbi:hypothetical protein B0H19DRAFT_1251908 [Mycena capillaripes]|nr:hypothetical protein B0H19DRAFT_1251908 [Mycena capillaripes]